MDGFLSKPIQIAELRAVLENTAPLYNHGHVTT
jgi:hypothetical protein